MFAENISHRPTVNVRQTSSVSERYRLLVVQRNGRRDSFVFVLFEVRPSELPKCVAFSAEDALTDGFLSGQYTLLLSSLGLSDSLRNPNWDHTVPPFYR